MKNTTIKRMFILMFMLLLRSHSCISLQDYLQQMNYSEDWLEDILDLKTPTEVDGSYFHDIMRAFKEDHHDSQFEAGQPKGGNFVCHGCTIDSLTATEVCHILLNFQQLPYKIEKTKYTHLFHHKIVWKRTLLESVTTLI